MNQILFKDGVVQREFAGLHPKLMEIVEFMSGYAWTMYKELLVCTCIVRTKKMHDADNHYKQKLPYRFIDFACLVKGDSERIRALVNGEFEYDLARPKLLTIPPLMHAGSNAPHLHVQVMP